ncbi:MAG: 2-iminoacetate synthase ThiH [bacterium]
MIDKRADLEAVALKARKITRQHFGRTISLYAPLYISNYCENQCLYCGFNAKLAITRKKLSHDEIERECQALKKTGLQNVLVLTGGSREHSPVSYIKAAALIAKKYFQGIAIEVYPLETKEYRELYLAGVDGVALYQETYDQDVYDRLHLFGEKKNYLFRYQAPERIAEAGIRQISMGVLLGLADWQRDISALFAHLEALWEKYPGVEFSLSFPRLRMITTDNDNYFNISDLELLQIIIAARLRFPRVGINMSTRENAEFRNKILEYGVTKISAGSSTSVGGYAINGCEPKQFSIHDRRSPKEIKNWLAAKGYDPVVTDWRSIPNE